jgi:phage/plasmid-like protein (TIGR03299 family)
MTREKIEDLNLNTLIGYTEKRGKAWHYREGAGNHFEGPVPMERIEKLFGWTALESDITYDVVLDGGYVGKRVDNEQKLYYRSDTGGRLGIHGKGHQRHQYMEWLINNVTTLVGGNLAIGQAGLLRGGAVAWVSVELADTLPTAAGIDIRPQMLNATSFDGSLASTNKLVSTIVVCDNTMDIGLSEKSQQYKVKHSGLAGHRRGLR